MNRSHQSRTAFTLVELLVVMALMAVLAGMVIAFFPNAVNSEREARAAQLLQGWLSIAKTRALRDQAPRGLRLIVTQAMIGGTTVNNLVSDCQYIEQPEDYTGGTIVSAAPPRGMPAAFTAANTLAFASGMDVMNGYVNLAADQQLWAVQPNDYLEVCGTGLMHRIVAVHANVLVNPPIDYIAIDPPLPNQINAATGNYRILRSPRALGDETMKLPEGTFIDLQTNATYASQLPGNFATDNYFDIVFSPSGTVISAGASDPIIKLWVRSPDESTPANIFAGRPTIMAVFAHTGFVAAFDVYKQNPAIPYFYVK